MKNFKISFFVILLCTLLAGCAALKGSTSTDNSALTGGIDHAGYPNAYLERIAGESIADLLSKRIVGKKGGRVSVVGIEPLASLSTDEVANLIGPVLQHYITGSLHKDPL